MPRLGYFATLVQIIGSTGASKTPLRGSATVEGSALYHGGSDLYNDLMSTCSSIIPASFVLCVGLQMLSSCFEHSRKLTINERF